MNLYRVGETFGEFWNRMDPIDPDAYLAQIHAREAEAQREDRAADDERDEGGEADKPASA